MTTANTQIVALYEEEGLSPEEIASSNLGYDLLSVKATLLANSLVYRNVVKGESGDKTLETAFSHEDQIAARDVIRNIALYGDDNRELQFKAAKYLRDDAKGRLDIAAGISSLSINVIHFQQQLDKVQRAKALTLAKKKALNIESNVSPRSEVLRAESLKADARMQKHNATNDKSNENSDAESSNVLASAAPKTEHNPIAYVDESRHNVDEELVAI